ncbi:MAG: exodeoxyribonuclease III [Alphaproteobacteria bacterium CG11_big_fil_rev_8_21_14_0_20_44_7]|nr:MAG: exodeoxyribonuclease III [Alphaproteobacteria bacterium CG11_big_fil_rev_8_21_14_0_20_44_7]
MRIATWNINSIRLRAHHIANIDADIICIQEMKCQDAEVPISQLEEMGFHHNHYRGQKAYNGVGIFSKLPLSEVEMLDFGGNDQARHISAKLPNGVRLHNFYIPAGGDEPDPAINASFAHKLQYVDDMTDYLKSLSGSHIILGDFNIAPFEHDVWSHKQLLKVISHTPIETEKLARTYKTLGWVDVSRHFVPMDEKCYSWWSYRNRDWRKSNRGRRLDHIWVTPDLKENLINHQILADARDWEKPSDHVPVIMEIDIS